MLVASHNGHVYLERRPEAGIWGGLWSFPEIEGQAAAWCEDRLGGRVMQVEAWQVLRHSFSHYDLEIQPIAVRVDAPLSKVADNVGAMWHPLGNELRGGIAAPVNRLLEKLKNVTHD